MHQAYYALPRETFLAARRAGSGVYLVDGHLGVYFYSTGQNALGIHQYCTLPHCSDDRGVPVDESTWTAVLR